MYLVIEVEGRTGIRIHPGNYAGAEDKGYKTDFLGCIGLGKGIKWDSSKKQFLLYTSAVAVADFERLLKKQEFMLHVTGDFNPL